LLVQSNTHPQCIHALLVQSNTHPQCIHALMVQSSTRSPRIFMHRCC
jgi:hypothetical protein